MILIILVLMGLCLGSFVNALIWRLHVKQAKVRTKKNLSAHQLSIINGRSVCTNCGHQLAVVDLIPVISWLWLSGKCRYCHKKIDDSPLVEIITPILFVISYLAWPYGFETAGTVFFIIWLECLVGFMALIVFDIRWFLLPDRILLPLTCIVVAYIIVSQLFLQTTTSPTQLITSVMVISGLFGGLYASSKGKWLGFGDVKLSFLLGLLAGTPIRAMLLIFIASVGGLLVSLPLLAAKKLKASSHIPFGPFLLLACMIVVLWGPTLERWLKDYLFMAA